MAGHVARPSDRERSSGSGGGGRYSERSGGVGRPGGTPLTKTGQRGKAGQGGKAGRRSRGWPDARGVAAAWLRLPLWGAAFGSVAAWFGDAHWLLDLFTHFPFQYLAILLVAAPAAWWLKRRRLAALALVLAALNVPAVAGELLPADRPVQVAHGPRLRVLSFNISALNSEPRRVAALARSVEADVVGLMETTPPLLAVLGGEMEQWPYQWVAPKADYLGLTLYSKVPIVEAALEFFGASGVPTLVATLDVQGQPLTFALTHLAPPFGPALSEMRNSHLVEMAPRMRQLPHPLVLCGDFNLTPFSGHFERFVAASGLADSRRGFGRQLSWPSVGTFLGIPIDHCFTSSEVSVVDRRIEDSAGSDHMSVVLDIQLPAGGQGAAGAKAAAALGEEGEVRESLVGEVDLGVEREAEVEAHRDVEDELEADEVGPELAELAVGGHVPHRAGVARLVEGRRSLVVDAVADPPGDPVGGLVGEGQLAGVGHELPVVEVEAVVHAEEGVLGRGQLEACGDGVADAEVGHALGRGGAVVEVRHAVGARLVA